MPEPLFQQLPSTFELHCCKSCSGVLLHIKGSQSKMSMACTHQAAVQVCREADGFQRSLVSPEAGLRRLVHDSVETVLIPVDTTVRRVHQVLMEASRCNTLPSNSPFACVTTA